MKVIIFNKYVMDLNIFLFETVKEKVMNSWVVQFQDTSTYLQSIIPVRMACKDQKNCIKPVFLKL